MDFTRKARFVPGGRLTDPPEYITYSSVVSRETAHIAFLIAALNGLDICAADIGNTYLNADCKERIWVKASKEFRADEGKPMIIIKILYGLKSSGAAWVIKALDFISSKADPDLSYCKQVKANGEKYYEYLLVYVDDILCLSEHTKPVMDEIGVLYHLKENSVGPPKRHLSADTKVLQMKTCLLFVNSLTTMSEYYTTDIPVELQPNLHRHHV